MRILSWNLAARRNKAIEQVEALQACNPDVFAGQEITTSSLPMLVEGLRALGFTHILDSFALATDPDVLVGPRRYGEIIASRFPLLAMSPHSFPVPWPERVLSCELQIDNQHVEFHTVHVPPGSSNGWIKIETFEGIFQRLKQPERCPRVLCGDFNSPDIEFADGRVKFFGQHIRPDGTIVGERHRNQPRGRWGDAERGVILGLAEYNLPDVFRALHGYEVHEASWFSQREGKLTARRFDHIFASKSLTPISCGYLHEFRLKGLSDHSAISADLVI